MIIDQNKLDDDLIPLREAAAAAGCTESELLRMAANDEILLYVELDPYTANLVAVLSHEKPMSSNRRCSGEQVPLLQHYAKTLKKCGKVEIRHYEANVNGKIPQWDWHYWVLEEPQIATIEHIYIARGHVTGEQLPEADTETQATPLQRSAAQDCAILTAIEQAGHNPLMLPVNESGRPGVKAAIRGALKGNTLFVGGTVFDKAWERLRSAGGIVDKI